MPSLKILKANHARYLPAFLLVALAVLGAVLVLLRNHPYGPGLHFDAINYIGVARNLLAGEGWIQFHGSRYVFYPPLYPTLLALSGLLSGFDPRDIAGPLNALLFGLTVFVAARWLLERVTSRWLALWGGLAAAFSLPLTSMASHAMTEPAFILFVTMALFYMDRYLRGRRRGALIWAALFTSLAWLTRYVGVAAILTLLPFLLFQPGVRLLEKLKRTAVFGLIASIPISLWLIERLDNRLRAWPPSYTLSDFLEASLSTLGRWILPILPQGAAMALAAVMLFALAVAVGFAFVRKPLGWRTLCLCGNFTLIYFISMGIAITIVEYDVVSWHSRYWTPMYIPLLIALVFALDRLLIWLRSAGRQPALKTFASGAIALLLLIWLGGVVELNRQAIISASQGDKDDKFGAAAHVVNNDVIQFIQKASAPDKIFLNRAYYSRLGTLYIHAGRPLADFRFLPQDLERLPQTVEAAATGDLLIWFHDAESPYSYGLPELEAMPALERIATLPSGVVFRINRL